MLLGQIEVFIGVQGSSTLHPWVDGVVGNDVEFFVRRAYKIARVIVNNLDSRIAEDVVIFFFEIAGHYLRYQRFDFAYHDSFNARIQSKSSGRYAGAKSDDQHRTRSRVIKRREMA